MNNRSYIFSLLILFNVFIYAQNEELCEPRSVSVFGGDQANVISWSEPGGNLACGDYLIDQLPYTHVGNNSGQGNDWPLVYDGDDIAYTLNVTEVSTYDITLCSFTTDYDSYIEIFTNDANCLNPVSTGNGNDDDGVNCPDYSAPYPPSGLWAVTLQPGQYYIAVGGFSGATGNYEISVSLTGTRNNDNVADNFIKSTWSQQQEKMADLGMDQETIDIYTNVALSPERYRRSSVSREIPEECGTFSTYAVYNAQNNTLIVETADLTYTHSGLTNGTEYCYYIKTVYEEGSSVATESVCGTPSTWAPAPPTNVYAEVWDEEVSVYWTSPDVSNLNVPYIENFDEGGLLDLWLTDGGDNWVYNDAAGNPAPAMYFSWTPSVENYDQSLYSPSIPLGALTQATISFDWEFSNYEPTGEEYFSVEYKTGSDVNWTVAEEFSNSGEGFNFTNFSYDLDNLSGNLQVRFHCYGANSFNLNWYMVDNFSVTSGERTSRNEYDFLGYNVYVDGVLNNEAVFDTVGYTVYGLDNEIEYTFGVTSVFEGPVGEENYESDPVNVMGQPIYVYGDITGTITDPNGVELDSVIVSSNGVSDTTGTDGIYYLYNLDVGINSVQVRKSSFYTTTQDVVVLAQADPTIQDFVMSPDMPSPVALNAMPMDEEVFLEWREPGGVSFYDVAYYDNSFEGQIGCGGTCGFGVRFTPENYPATLTGLVLSFQGGGTAAGANVELYLDPQGLVAGPVGEPITLVASTDFSAPEALTQYQVDASDAGIEILSGDLYVIVNENNSGFMGISNDIEPQTPENYSRNWVTLGDGAWSTINDVVAGDPTLTGNFGVLAQFLGAPGLSVASSATSNLLEQENSSFGIISNYNSITSEEFRSFDSVELPSLESPYIPLNPTITNIDRDDLIEYRVYQVDPDGNETFVVATADTFATVLASPNYLEYCFNVSAFWSTDNYGDLESNHSNTACAVPYKYGDADFDSDTDITDVLSVVDFILEEDIPTDDEFRNVDVNMDESINIADVIMIVDIIFGSNARVLNSSSSDVAYVDLVTNYSTNNLIFKIKNAEIVRGIQFDLNYDVDLVEMNSPSLTQFKEEVLLSSNTVEEGIIKVLAANLNGGGIIAETDSYIKIPFNFKGNKYDASMVVIENVKLVGIDGSLIDVVVKTSNSKINFVPNTFSLKQNYPNPFNPKTEIKFDIPKAGFITLSVHNMLGQRVKTLKSEVVKAGYHSVTWDGTNDIGSLLSSGMYFYSIQTVGYQSTKKMLFLK